MKNSGLQTAKGRVNSEHGSIAPPSAGVLRHSPTGNGGARPTGRRTGVVKRFGASYGFVTLDSGAGDVFVSISEVRPPRILEVGQRVELEMTTGAGRSPTARNVKVLWGPRDA
jgi:cold shock CspA family protein